MCWQKQVNNEKFIFCFQVENILINSDGGFLLCDFGSATQQVLQGSVNGITHVGDEIQKYTTLAYRAPEMVDIYLDKPITHKSDVWVCLIFFLIYFIYVQIFWFISHLWVRLHQLNSNRKWKFIGNRQCLT